MRTVAYALGEILGLMCGVLLPAAIVSYGIGRHIGTWTPTLFGVVLLIVALVVSAIMILSKRGAHNVA